MGGFGTNSVLFSYVRVVKYPFLYIFEMAFGNKQIVKIE
ncbi:hypothetical protein LEP1GSC048_3309 [Leptospira santarosai serovar Shermani str. 1342KT]|nr:hypothetical protein LEP1GSC048_3309 [Leptospira santarosai serovar Shermani str. 1342KT]